MKILQRLLLFILLISGVFISVGYLLPQIVRVERSLQINASAKSIFDELNTLNNWGKWSPWLKKDTNVQIKFSGPENGTGSKIEWASKDKTVGNGSVSIIGSLPNDSISFIMDYGKRGKSTGCFKFIKEKQGTKVVWSIESNLGSNPVSRWIGLLSDKMIGPDLEKGLLNIKTLINSIQSINKYEIVEVEVPACILISIRDTASPSTMNSKMTLMFEKLSKFLKKRNLSPSGVPITIFHAYTDGNFDIETCLPISSVITVPKGMSCYEVGNRKSIMTVHFGSHKQISKAYDELRAYLLDNKLDVSGSGWEAYKTNPYLESDSTKWQTNIYFPIY
jgi:effector-binding domain-containing protein